MDDNALASDWGVLRYIRQFKGEVRILSVSSNHGSRAVPALQIPDVIIIIVTIDSGSL